MMNQLKTFLRDEEGATAIEYGLIAGLIAVAIVSILLLMSPNLKSIFTRANDGLTSANAAS